MPNTRRRDWGLWAPLRGRYFGEGNEHVGVKDVQSNLDALNRTYETYNGTSSLVMRWQVERSFYVYHCWLSQHGFPFYLDLKSDM